MNDLYVDRIEILQAPKYTWSVHLTYNTCVYQEKAPNWFWRTMQYLVFGFKWEKL